MSNRRYAFLPLSKSAVGSAVQNELLVDYNEGDLFINESGTPKLISGESEDKFIDEAIERIIGADDISIEELSYIIAQITKYRDSIMNSGDGDPAEGLDFIYSIVKELIVNNINLKQLVDTKVSGHGVLSDHDFNDVYVEKLQSIDKNANHYVHPSRQVCDMRYVKSLNNKTGDVPFGPDDVEDLDVDPNANYYVHSNLPECDLTDNGVSFLNGRRGEIRLSLSDIGILNMEDMGLNNDVSKYLHLPTDYRGYATPKSAKPIMDFYMLERRTQTYAICSVFESRHELASDMYEVGLAGIRYYEGLAIGEPYLYSNMTGFISSTAMLNAIRDYDKKHLGEYRFTGSISNKGVKYVTEDEKYTRYATMNRDNKIIIHEGSHGNSDFTSTPTDTGIFVLSDNKVTVRAHKDYKNLGFDHESYAIRGGSYKHIAESINSAGRGIISIASDHETFFAFTDMYGVTRVVFTNQANRYTHNGKGGMLHDL